MTDSQPTATGGTRSTGPSRGDTTTRDVPVGARTRPDAATDDRRSTTGRDSGPSERLRVLFDVAHPAHAHLFRHAHDDLVARGHHTRVTSRDKDVTLELLDAFGIDHTPLSAKGTSKLSLATEFARRERRLLSIGRSFDPDVIVSLLNPPAAHVATLLGCPNVVFDDSERSHLGAALTHPFADLICTPSWFDRDLGPKHRRYEGFHELAYLRPNRFDPDPDALAACGVDVHGRYAVLRFVSWGAHHDVGQAGLPRETKRALVSFLDSRGEVYITSEAPLPDEFEPYRLPVPPHRLHDLLSYADLYVGDSQTMATEAAVLGTPAVRSNSFAGAGDMTNFVRLEEEYGLLSSIPDPPRVLERVEELVADPDVAETWRRRRSRLLDDTVDVTDYVVDLVETVGAAGAAETAGDAAGRVARPALGRRVARSLVGVRR